MAKLFPQLTAALIAFIESQKIFFVGSAPHAGRVNVSPKGLETFRVLHPARVGYLDATGSGNETAAHLLENARVTFMFCAFDGAPLILRLYGRGRAVHPRDAEWAGLRPCFGPPLSGERQLIVAEIENVQTSCGFGVPLFDYEGQRSLLPAKAEKRGPAGVAAYWAEKNLRSIDGLPTGLLEP
ncbi:MAG: pyridoxamine 5'-phosphate oxidase family protein [Opitutaceae bacterium]